ncbi:MAG: leucine-rich repeat protein [Clostridiales bacterium]|nr:leucine-rich repeat protein [Clostridiales bacterium]
MKNKYKIMSLLLAVVMVVSILPFGAFAETEGDWEYSLENDGTAVITGYNGTAATVEVPATIAGSIVSGIGDRAFRNKTGITSIELPGRLTSIGNDAFSGCTSLQSITIPQGVSEIGEDIFYECSSLQSINVDENNNYYASEDGVLFDVDMTELICYPIAKPKTSYELPETVERIKARAFQKNKYLEQFQVLDENALCEIGEDAFSECEKLQIVLLMYANRLASIGNGAFAACYKLQPFVFPNDPCSLTAIPDGLFYGDNSVSFDSVPESITSIGKNAFAYVYGIDSFTIGPNVSEIALGAFNNFHVKKFIVDSNNRNYATDENGVLYNKSMATVIRYPIENENSEYTLPDSCTGIGSYAFEGCKLNTLQISASVTGFGQDVFKESASWFTVKCPCNSETEAYCAANNINTTLSHTYKTGVCTRCGDWQQKGVAVKLVSITNVSTGIQIKWNAIPGAEGYMIYYDSEAAGSSLAKWHFVDSVEGGSVTSYTDTSKAGGKTYRYTVKAFNGNQYSKYNNTGLSIKYLKMPTAKLENKATGEISATWSSVAGATGYYVYRMDPGSTSWTRIGTTAGTSWTDKAALNGKTYKYTVKAYNNANNKFTYSAYKPITIVKLAAPKIVLNNTKYGIQMRITAVKGAKGYYIYRKEKGGSYSKIGSTTGDTYLDKNAKKGVVYYYTARAYNGTSLSSFVAKSMMHLVMGKLTGKNVAGGIQISWSKAGYAKGYNIYRKGSDNVYKKIGTTTSLSYIDTKVKPGVSYAYAVRAYNGSYESSNDDGAIGYRRLVSPTVTLSKPAPKTVKITIGKVSGAKGYEIYRKVGSGSYTKIATTTSLTYSDKNVQNGKKYTYAVRAYNGNSYGAYTTKSIAR